TTLGVVGEDPTLEGYEPGIDFLLKVHDHVAGIKPVSLKGDVIVVGGGNVAMDCVRSAIRMGADRVHLVYRRTRADMPADPEE
ncbi:FAD-dependent oxidoreductase, partial [Mycobacterium tuberculosis]|nr:FAD-dependent oxidoreductase [Mycobacterium tuberculosis]